MKKTLLIYLISLLIVNFSWVSSGFSQYIVIDFENPPSIGAVQSISVDGFTFAATLTNNTYIGFLTNLPELSGSNNSTVLVDTNIEVGGLTIWTISRDNGEGFQFSSIYIQERGFGSLDGYITGYKEGVPTGASKPISFNGVQDFSDDPDFFDVDEIQIEADDFFVAIDDFTYGSAIDPVDNIAPTDILLDNSSVAENEAVGSLVGLLSAEDPDIGDTFTFSLVSGAGDEDNSSFSIIGNELRTAEVFDFETKSSYNIRIRVIDSGGLFFEKLFTISVLNVNENPSVIAPLTISVFEDQAQALTGISFSDPDSGINPVTATFTVDSGSLAATSANGVTVTGSSDNLELEGSLSDINDFISAGNLIFTTALNATSDVTLTIIINDNGHSGIGGALTDQASVNIQVTAVNDAPVNSVPGTQQVDQNSALVFSSANGNPISVSDVDAGGASIKISLAVTNGVLTLSGSTGLNFTSGTGVNNSTMVFEGSITNINVALEGMVFTPTSGFSGSATLTITSDDQGFSGSGGALTATDEVLINVNIVAPVISSVTVPSDGVYAIGENLDFTLNFSEVVTVNGSPQLSLTIGSTTRQATYISGSGTNALVFRYTVQSGDLDLNGILAGTLSLNGGTIRDFADNNANLTLNAIGSTAQVLVDGVRPTVSSLSLSNTTYAIGQTGTLTVVFSERIAGLETNDFTVSNGTLSGLSSSDGGITWTATFTPSSNVQQTVNLITLDNTGYTDLAGNAGTGTTDSNNYAIDTQRPTATVAIAENVIAIGDTPLVTITFSEAITGLTLADFLVANGSLSNLLTTDGGITWTALLTPDNGVNDMTNVITLDNTGFQDFAGNTGIGTTDSNNYTIDTQRPTAIIVVADTQLIIGDVSVVTITFSEAVTGLTLTDFSVANGILSDLSSADGGITWTALLTPDNGVNDPTNVIVLDNTEFQDSFGNTGVGITNSNNYAVITTTPTATLIISDTQLIIGETTTLTITFSEAVTGLVISDFTVANGVLSGLTSSDGGITWTATLTPSNGVDNPTNVITLDNTSYQSVSGNAGTGTTDSNNYAIDTQRPTATITVADDQLTVGETTSVTIIFSEAVTGLTLADFSVSNGILTSLSTNDNITYTATLTPTINTEQATNLITLDNTGYQDVPGNTGIGATDSNNYLVDTRPPLVQTQDLTVQLGVDGTASILASQVDNNSIDGFGIASVSVNQTSFDCSDVGPNTLTLTVTDNNGNQATGTAIVTVEDVTGPEVTTQNISIQLDTSGSASINAIDLVFESTDACGVSSTTASQTDFDSNDIGENIISVTVTDTNGNSTTATAIVEVLAIDITGITFEDQSFVFDGTEKSLEITGTLPAGTSVAYDNNTRTDVGTQEATATISGSNYTTLVLTADLTITPATITGITFENQSFVFDGTEKSIEITGTLPVGTSVAYDNNTRTDVGTQEATATISGSNYTTLVLTANLTITPATITGITFEDGSFVFDGTEKSIEITGTLPVGTSVAYDNNTRTDVGTQEATATISGSNYTTLVLTADLTITPATITGITFEDGSFVYDGTEKSIEITGTLPVGTSVSYENNTRTNVGTQEATATITGSNYTTLVLTADLTITPATITGITFEDGDFVFDGTEKSLEITGTLPAGTSVSYENNTRTNVGTQEATATITGSNYTTLVLTADLTITPATITGVTFEDGSFVFDGTVKSIEITGTLPVGTSVAYDNNTRTDVGTQGATATISGSNYTTLVLTADLTITPATITGVTFEDGSFVFDGTERSLEITGTLPAGTSVAYDNNTRTDIGTQEAIATITGDNFTSLVLTADLTITPAVLEINPTLNQGKVYGESDPMLTFTATGFGSGDDEAILTGSIVRVAGEHVGSYAITQGSLDAGANYSILFNEVDFHITQAQLTITAADQTKVYGTANPSLTFSYDGLVNGDTKVTTEPSISTSATASSAVGTYPITLTGGEDDNYEITLVAGALEVTKATLTITADSQIKPFGVEDPALTYQVSGLVNGDQLATITGSLQRAVGEEPGSYAIGLGSLSAGANYTINFVSADLTITASEIDMVFQPANVETAWGQEPALPSSIGVMTADGQVLSFPITWNLSPLNIYARGDYALEAVINLSEGYTNPMELMANVTVTVLPKPAPQDLLLDNLSFRADSKNYQVRVGGLSVVDPVDNVHSIELVQGAYESSFFAIINNALYWNTTARVEGKKTFEVLIRVTDRDGNVIEKVFTIERTRESVSAIEIYNSFSPNGDGTNDTWGVPELRYYSGVVIQVFERSGKRLFYTQNPDIKWDGFFETIALPTGTYYWTVEVKETGEVRKGMLNLFRK
ncbi:Ig-like domain-containing protein [Belliella sp. DSM 111904]|uniref:Ig-like domain-containing protein n=1 Tax=Belliella filtrata TaxID=2923435 RepID=A0ABS9V404_9BACT|nr:Ig-like domain-containing protein [Belliella filtrata]MCH7410708.1 Ig-like domain-containing protein [Belliella filtrata]